MNDETERDNTLQRGIEDLALIEDVIRWFYGSSFNEEQIKAWAAEYVKWRVTRKK